MKSYTLRTEGSRSVLQYVEVPVPEPGPGQLLLRVHAAGLNRGEFLTGGLQAKGGAAKPAGMEAAGEVLALGVGVTGYAVGDRVMGRCPGAFAEFALVEAFEALPVPASLSFEEAAAVPLVFMVVHDMLIGQGRLRAGEWLLIAGVSSGVGVAALQAAKALGAKVIGTSGSDDKLQRLKTLGLDLGIATRAPSFHAAVMQVTEGRGADLVINAVGGTVFAECQRCLAFEGRLATVGYVDGVFDAAIDLQALHLRRQVLFGVSNKQRSAGQRAATVRGFVADLLPAIADGRIRPLVDRVFPFDEAEAAQAHMQDNHHVGKIVLTMAPSTIPEDSR